MAAFLGARETLQPRAAKQHRGSGGGGKRGRAKDGADVAAAVAETPGVNVGGTHVDSKVEAKSSQSTNAEFSEPAEKKKKSGSSSTAARESSSTNTKKENDSDVAVPSANSATNDNAALKDVNFSPAEIITLLDQLLVTLPQNDEHTKYSTMADKLEWDKVKVGSHTSQECKDQWLLITTKLRRYRTMRELVVDAKQWAKHPWNAFGKKVVKHPEMPKKPLTPYFRFFMRKRIAYAKKHPDMSVTELTKELSKKYGILPENKKQKYLDSYNRDMEDWKAQMVKFRHDHPEMFADESTGSGSTGSSLAKQLGFVNNPPKTTTAMQLYINEKCEEDQKKGSKSTRKELYEKYKSLWQSLAETKKLKYIKLAMEAKKKYDKDMEKYCSDHPEYQPRVVKTFLSKAEQKLKDRIDGKPEKPPSNGYSLFTVETLPLLTHLPNNERLGEVSRRWKKLSEDKKEAYNLKAEERNQEYKRAYSKYLLSLPDEVRKRLEKEDVDKQVKKKPIPQPSVTSPFQVVTPPVDRPLKPVADVFMFIEDKKAEYKKKYPAMDENELHRFMVKEFNCISERDKAKYKKMAEQEKERLAKESAQSLNNSLKKIKRVPFEGEPVKPSHSGYQLFSKEMLVQLRDIKANERLQEIGRRWIALNEDDKRQWNKRKDALWVQYSKDLAKFKRGLSPKDLKRYEEMNAPSGSKKKKKKSKAKEEPSNPTDDEDSSSNESDKNSVAADGDGNMDHDADSASSSDSDDSDPTGDISNGDASSDSSDDDDAVGNNDNHAKGDSSDDEDGDVNIRSESEADEETAVQLTKVLVQDKAGQSAQGKSNRLNANEVYNDDSSDSSSDSDSSDSSS